MAALKSKNIQRVNIILILFSIIIIPLVYNYVYFIPQIALLFLSPFLVCKEGISTKDRMPVLLILAILMTRITHPAEFRLSTVGYSILYVTTFMYYTKILSKSRIEPVDLLGITRGIIVAYAVVLAIQLVSWIAGIGYILNASYNTADGLKFNSLTYEASQIGPIITILMYTYIKVREMVIGRKIKFKDLFSSQDKRVFLLYVFTSLFSFSVTTYMAFLILMLYFVRTRTILIGAGAIVIGIAVFFSLDTEVGNRILVLLEVLPSLDIRTIYEADPSASARIAPILVFFDDFDLFSFNTWFGYGCDYGNMHIWHTLIGHENSDESLVVPGIIAFIYDYGMIAFFVFLKFIQSFCKLKSFAFLIYVTCFFLTGFNMASTWLFMMLMYTLNNINKQYKWKLKYQL